MSRYFATEQTPPQPTTEGDEHFLGVNLKLDRSQLDPGYLARAENCRLNRGRVESRRGTIMPVFANVFPFPEMLGAGVYSNPNGQEVILLATASAVIQTRSGSYPTAIAIPSGVTLSAPVEFSQQFDKVLLHHLDGDVLEWDGLSPAGFAAIAKPDPNNNEVSLMPPCAWSVNYGDRAIFPISIDEIGISEEVDYQVYDPIEHVYRINTGSADGIVGVYPYANGNLVVGKRYSLDLLANVVGDLSSASMQVLSTQVGVVARRSGKMVGADLWFLSDNGVYRVGQVIQGRIETQPVPVSDKIEPLIARINWAAAEDAVAAVHGIYYYLAVPLDGSPANNAVLVCNTVTGEWESLDLWDSPTFQLDHLLVSDYFGTRRLYGVNARTKSIYLLYEGNSDVLSEGETEIGLICETRGYSTLGWNASTSRDSRRVEIGVATWNPSIEVTLLTDKADDERPLHNTPITRSNVRYGNSILRPDYDATNANDDADAPGREDYSVWVDDVAGVSVGSLGMEVEREQESVLRFSTRARSRWVSLRIANTQGRLAVLGTLLESAGTQREPKRAG